jgi:hypothetical protein
MEVRYHISSMLFNHTIPCGTSRCHSVNFDFHLNRVEAWASAPVVFTRNIKDL